jgi:ABC-type branched-subunit amino acid transport system ATPase component
MQNIIEIKNINKNYNSFYIDYLGKKNNETNAVLYDLSLSIKSCTISALIGGNGAGKTTLFNIICGYLSCDSGEILYHPNSNISYNLIKLKPWRTSKIGIGRMFQTPRIFRNLTILENMLLADENNTGDNPFYSLIFFKRVKEAENKKILKTQKIFSELFDDDSKFWRLRNVFAGELSYGEQRLLSLARLFMNDNLKLVLLDEPCAGVNAQIIDKISDLLKKMVVSGKTILLVEHNLEFVSKTADYTFYLEDGKVSVSGKTSEVLESLLVKEHYII